ncbi:MAG: DNA replication/repair protein RecF [bacterium]|nr:DNA replication/repair protein RecF [bacterium]
MIIEKVKLKNFRNINEIEFLPDKRMNIIYGQNAQGKTNILEALWLFSGQKSFRGAKDNELINFESKQAENKILFKDEDQNIQECKIIIKDGKKFFLNEVEQNKVSELAHKIAFIVFSPADIFLISEGPEVRRKFIDLAICKLYPLYNEKLKTYKRLVLQRNCILKDYKFHSDLEPMIEVFENSIAKFGCEIIRYRKRYLELLCKYLPEIFEGMSNNKENIDLEYICTASDNFNEFLNLLKQSRKEDINTLSTSIGPHRDNIEIKINNLSAKIFGSQGQKRTAALSLKLAEAKVLQETIKIVPIALLDDVMSELDSKRQNYILNNIDGWQVFITCCDPENIRKIKNGKIFKINNGKIES